MKEKNSYLRRLKNRRTETSLKSAVIFGQTIGWALTFVGSYFYFVELEAAALPVLILGNFLLLLGLGTPQVLEVPQRILQGLGNFVSELLFKVLLVILYLFVVFPLGLVHQKWKGTAPFYSWKEETLKDSIQNKSRIIEGWTIKFPHKKEESISTDRLNSPAADLLELLGYFIKHGELLVVPCMVLAVGLGLVLVFIQTTPLAPMIYTLF